MPQDYSGQNLRGRSFRGQNLEGANFSGADIRSADFSTANLKGANFSHVKAGLQKRWATSLVLVSCLISGLAGFLSAYAGALVSYIVHILIYNSLIYDRLIYDRLDLNLVNLVVLGWTVSIVFIVVLMPLRTGSILAAAFGGAGVGVVALAGALLAGALTVRGEVFTVAVATTSTGATVGFGGVFAFAGAVVVAFAVIGAGAGAGSGARAVVVAFAITGAGAGIFSFTEAVIGAFARANTFTGAFGIAFLFVVTSINFSWLSLTVDKSPIRNIAVAFAAFQGTSFRSVDLTDADFTSAILKSTDFRKANLTRTCFHKTKKLDRVRPGTTYLQKTLVREVLVTGLGRDQNFDRLDLRGVNFKGAYLVDASFIGADLSNTNLQDADLSRAKLVQAQLDGTDFTGATLTGAYIKDWNITSDTNFNGVRCQYVYMRLLTKENPNPLRKPDNNKEVFKDGEFGDFIQSIFDTAAPPVTVSVPDNLSSDAGVDYTRLQDLLAAQKWEEADEETITVMLKATGREVSYEFIYRLPLNMFILYFPYPEFSENIPCSTLRTIDQLWVKYSNGRFGFSVQKRIWDSVGHNSEKFGDRVGWKKGWWMNKYWIEKSEVTFGTSAPVGHLPWKLAWVMEWSRVCVLCECLFPAEGAVWARAHYEARFAVFSRIETCNTISQKL